MDPPFQQVVLGNQQHSPVAPGFSVNSTTPDGRLWGSNVRRSMGIVQIICGGIEFVLGIVAIRISNAYFDSTDQVGWGMWTGAFAIVTGFLGVFSLTKRYVVIAYMITSIITAVLCAGCLIYAVYGALFTGIWVYNATANLAVYSIMCIIFFIHMVISIIGASFTCGALLPATNQPQQVVYYTPQPLQHPYGPIPPYTVVASKSGITSQTTTPDTNGAFMSPKI